MKATVNRAALARIVKTVQPAAQKASNTLAILAGVRIEVTADSLSATCTDLDLAIHSTTSIEPGETGIVVVPAGLFSKLADKLSGETIDLYSDGEQLTVTAGETVASLPLFDASEWPKVPQVAGKTADVADLDALARILPMAASDPARGHLCALATHDGYAYTTDSYRAARLEAKLPDFLVPAATMVPILHKAETLTVKANASHVEFCDGTTTWTIRQMVGEYPYAGITQLVEVLKASTLILAVPELGESLQRLSVFDVDELKQRRGELTREGDRLRLAVEHPTGTMVDVIACDGTYDSSISLNLTFLADLIAASGDDEVTIGIEDGMKAITCQSHGLQQVCMPLAAVKPK